LRTEILLWSLLEHPNILPLIGITETETYMGISMVAPWCRNGNLSDYSKKQRNAYINRLQQLADIGSALTYLHNHVPTIIHGDLKCANVLVSDDGRPLLCDFGLATLRYNGATMSSALDSGSVRWMAIELISILDKPTINKETDIWAFAMLALELLTGDLPFSDKRNDMAV
ncbi:kinase-like protein, partial [Punctularia strigosozonata HHB-11173 SS5]